MIKLKPAVKFSDSMIIGAPEKRKKLVSDLNEALFNAIQPRLEQGPITLNELREVYYSILPEEKRVKIFPLPKNKKGLGYCGYLYGGDLIKAIKMEIPLRGYQFYERCLTILMHENTHVLDFLVNPKTSALVQKLTLLDKYSEKREDWYDNVLYHREENPYKPVFMTMIQVRNKTLKFLKGMSTEDKIAILQDARYSLELERNAYSEQLKYAKRLKQLGRPVSNLEIYDADEIFLFSAKIEVLKSIIRKLISEERKIIGLNLNI